MIVRDGWRVELGKMQGAAKVKSCLMNEFGAMK